MRTVRNLRESRAPGLRDVFNHKIIYANVAIRILFQISSTICFSASRGVSLISQIFYGTLTFFC